LAPSEKLRQILKVLKAGDRNHLHLLQIQSMFFVEGRLNYSMAAMERAITAITVPLHNSVFVHP
jgi:hypothetical protein